MLWFDRHRRFRASFSGHIDGRLSSSESRALESHLESCEPCRRDLDELRAVVIAVRDLPEVEVPRSFALTPAQAARPAPSPLPSAPSLAVGMRVSAVGLAFALAVVLVIDAGDFRGGDGTGSDNARPAAQESANVDQISDDAASRAAAPAVTGLPSGETNAYSTLDSEADKAARCAEAPDGSVRDEDNAFAAIPSVTEPPPQPASGEATPAPVGMAAPDDAGCLAAAPDGESAPSPAVLDPIAELERAIAEGLELDRTADAQSDGLSALRVVEIALAAALAVVLTGIIIRVIAARRRTE